MFTMFNIGPILNTQFWASKIVCLFVKNSETDCSIFEMNWRGIPNRIQESNEWRWDKLTFEDRSYSEGENISQLCKFFAGCKDELGKLVFDGIGSHLVSSFWSFWVFF